LEVFPMKMKMLLILMSLVGLMVLLIPACAKPAAPAEILVGNPASLTGMFAGFGEAQVFGMKAAIDDINKQGGVYVKEYGKKLPIKPIVVNSESDPLKAGTLAESLIVSDKVNFLVQGGETPVMPPGISTVADRYKIPYITAAGPMEPWLAQREAVEGHWEYTWAAGFPIATPAPAGSWWAKPGFTVMDNWKSTLDLFGDQTNKKVAVFASDDSDGIAWYGLFGGALGSWGYDAVGVDKKLGLVPMETTDFTSIINEWKAANCEILWGNAPAPFVGTLLKQCAALGFKPKMASIGRGAMFYEDVTAWGGDLPNGIGMEIWGDPSLQESEGIGGATLASLAEKWTKETGKPLNRCIGSGYRSIQILIDAIERAGTLDAEKVNAALAQTDLMTIMYRVKFDENHFTPEPLAFGQWQKTDKPWVWECPVVFSLLDVIKATAEPIFPIPYK
jgi:ABC-type branched-subunit amino acid transport system substrate-binding protein